MLIEIFCQIDDFCKQFKKYFNKNVLTIGNNLRKRAFALSISEIITISIYYHYSGFKNFKYYYLKHVLINMKNDFKNLVSYTRFLELKKMVNSIMNMFIQFKSMNKCTGISYIDSYPLKVCNIKRSYSHKVLSKAAKGKTSVGWFYGFKLHLITNHMGDVINFYITPGNVADNNRKVIEAITKNVTGKVFGDRGYLVNSKFFKQLYSNGLKIVTKIRKNMNNVLIDFDEKILLRKRGIIESVGSILKECFSLEHARHRSELSFFSHILSTLCAYIFKVNKPSIC